MGFLARNSRTLNASCAAALSCGESTYPARVRVFSSEQIPVTFSALPNNTVDLPFVLVQWIHSELFPCDRRNTQACSWPTNETLVLFSAEVNSVFSTACSVVLFPYQISLHCVKEQMKCEADVVSRHVSRFEAPFLRKIFSFPNLPLQSVALFSYSYSVLLLLLSHLIFDLKAPMFVICPHLHLPFAFLAAHFFGRLAHLLALPWTACAIQNTQFLHSVFTISHC